MASDPKGPKRIDFQRDPSTRVPNVIITDKPIDLSTCSGDAPRCPVCFRMKANDDDRQASMVPRLNPGLCWRWVIPGPGPTADCEANRIDLAAIERRHPGALMGCVLLADASVPQYVAALNERLVWLGRGGQAAVTINPTGDRVLAALRALGKCFICGALPTGLVAYEDRRPLRAACDEHSQPDDDAWFIYGEDGDETPASPILAAALALHEREASEGVQNGECPSCKKPHWDEGEWATRRHTTHRCVDDRAGTGCGHEWEASDGTG